jgi:hypothetical protein
MQLAFGLIPFASHAVWHVCELAGLTGAVVVVVAAGAILPTT